LEFVIEYLGGLRALLATLLRQVHPLNVVRSLRALDSSLARMLRTVKGGLKDLTRVVTALDRLSGAVAGAFDQAAPGRPSHTPLKHEIIEIIPLPAETVVSPGGRVTEVFLLDGRRCVLPKALADVLRALAIDDGTGTGRFVAAKSRERLQATLGISESALANRVCRLRNFLTAILKWSRNLVETDVGRGTYRLHLVRGGWRGT
jgi:hypothetical protein